MSLSGDKGVAQFKKGVKMGHPTGQHSQFLRCFVIPPSQIFALALTLCLRKHLDWSYMNFR